jgi:hypothetical protein
MFFFGELDQADQRHANADHRRRNRQDMRSERFASGSYRQSVGHGLLAELVLRVVFNSGSRLKR